MANAMKSKGINEVGGHLAQGNTYRILSKKPEQNGRFGSLRHNWDDSIRNA
jgi:hypothetical protein